MVIFWEGNKYLILLLNKEHRDHGLSNLLSRYPLDLVGKLIPKVVFFSFPFLNVLWLFFFPFFLRKRYSVLEHLMTERLELHCSVAVSVGLVWGWKPGCHC